MRSLRQRLKSSDRFKPTVERPVVWYKDPQLQFYLWLYMGLLMHALRFPWAETTKDLISLAIFIPFLWAFIVVQQRRGSTKTALAAPSTFTDTEVRGLIGASWLGGAGLALFLAGLYVGSRSTEHLWLAPLGIGLTIAGILITRVFERRRAIEIFRAYDANQDDNDRAPVFYLKLEVDPRAERRDELSDSVASPA